MSVWRSLRIDAPQANRAQPLVYLDQSGGRLVDRHVASHVGDQRILKYSPQLYNLSLGQLQFRNSAYSLLQLIGYVSCEHSCPVSFRNECVLVHRAAATE